MSCTVESQSKTVENRVSVFVAQFLYVVEQLVHGNSRGLLEFSGTWETCQNMYRGNRRRDGPSATTCA